MKKTILAAALLLAGFLIYSQFRGGYVDHGRYVDKRYGFSIDLPEGWRVAEEKEVGGIGYQTQGRQRNLVFALADDPRQGMFAVSVVNEGVHMQDLLQGGQKARLLAVYRRAGLTISRDGTDDTSGIRILRIGGTVRDRYNEFAFFDAGNALVQVTFDLDNTFAGTFQPELERIVASVTSRSAL